MRVSDGWASLVTRYVPARRVSVHLTVPRKATPVLRFTLGPLRCRLSAALRSCTVTTYAPVASDFANEIVRPGPTCAVSAFAFGFGGGAVGGGAGGVPTVSLPFIVAKCASQT